MHPLFGGSGPKLEPVIGSDGVSGGSGSPRFLVWRVPVTTALLSSLQVQERQRCCAAHVCSHSRLTQAIQTGAEKAKETPHRLLVWFSACVPEAYKASLRMQRAGRGREVGQRWPPSVVGED